MIQSSNKLIVKDPFEMPAVDDTTVLVLRECADLVPHCWIWNESVGYLEVVTYSGYDIYVTVKNVGMKENATSGTIFPSCMEFLITAPNATPIIDNTVTCLRADFKCPTVGQEALMSVDSTSAIRVGDIIIVDTRYQYLVTEIINEHTMKVLNEEKGKEGGVIDVKCNECVPVKIFESTHCCEALQEQVDDIYSRIDTKKSIDTYVGSLVAITNGLNSLTDVANNVYIDVNPDLSYYDNSVSKFTSLRYFNENTSGVNAFFNPDRSTGYTNYDLGTNTNYFNNAYINKIQGGQGRSSFISFPTDGSDTMYSNGTTSLYNAHAFYSGGKKLVAFAYDQAEFSTKILPTSTSTYDLGGSTATWNNIYTDSITLNGTTYTSFPTVNDATLIIYESDGVTPFVTFTANASSNVSATLPSSPAPTINGIVIDTSISNEVSIDMDYAGITSHQAQTGYLGKTYPWDNIYVKTITGQNLVDTITYPSSNAADHDIIYDAGTMVSDHGHHRFNSGGITSLIIGHEFTTTGVDIFPETDNMYDLGSSSKAFAEGYINSASIKEITGASSTPNSNSLILRGRLHIYNGTTHVLEMGFSQFNPINDDQYSLGTQNNRYANLWAVKINGSFYNPSDRDKKENIVKRNNNNTKGKKTSLEIVNSLDTYTYNYKNDKDKLLHIGIMAQDLESLEPDCVVDKGSENEKGEKDKDLYIDTFGFITILLEAVQELSDKVKDLESKLGEKDADSKVLEK